MALKHRPPTFATASASVLNLQVKQDGTLCDQIPFALRSGEVVCVVGPNGAGKSALIEELCRQFRLQADIELFSGYRQIHFGNDDVDQMGQSLSTFNSQLSHPQVSRVRNPWGEQHLKSVIRRLINRQYQDNEDMLSAIRAGMPAAEAEQKHSLVLDELNSVFQAARLEVKIVLSDGTLKAKRGDVIYGIDRMSDGERSAILLAGAILVRPSDGLVVIDEPERHLNPAISGPLISAIIRVRPDVGYLFATHDLDLLSWMAPTQVIHVLDSEVIVQDPEMRRYNVEQVSATFIPSESLKTAVFGSRRALLLVEGTELSSDEALLGMIYLDHNVVGRGDWESVVTEVKGLNRSNTLHRLNVSGIIDGDGRNDEEVEKLRSHKIFCLPCPTIENIFFVRPLVSSIIELQYSLIGGVSPPDRMSSYQSTARTIAENEKDEMINRRTTWLANRTLAERKVSVKSIREGQEQIEAVNINSIREKMRNQVEQSLKQDDIHLALMSLPIKNTGVPKALSRELGFDSFPSYKQAILHQIQTQSTAGLMMADALSEILPKLELS